MLAKYLPVVFVVLLLLPWKASFYFIQFGVLGWLFALFGYTQKNADTHSRYVRMAMLVFAFLIWDIAHAQMMHLDTPENILLAALMISCGAALRRYRPHDVPLPAPLRRYAPALQWPARYSLWIYVAHLAALQLATRTFV